MSRLQCLQHLDLSRNQLTYLPAALCQLSQLQSLVVNNNKLVSLPEEIGELTNLMQLDVSCNEIAHLPVQIGDLSNLKHLNLRRNHLQEVSVEMTYLQLSFLDLSSNRIVTLPVELRFMLTLVELYLYENPLTCPPANLCGRGRVHIFKYLETIAIKEDKNRNLPVDRRRTHENLHTVPSGQLGHLFFIFGFLAVMRIRMNYSIRRYNTRFKEITFNFHFFQVFYKKIKYTFPNNLYRKENKF